MSSTRPYSSKLISYSLLNQTNSLVWFFSVASLFNICVFVVINHQLGRIFSKKSLNLMESSFTKSKRPADGIVRTRPICFSRIHKIKSHKKRLNLIFLIGVLLTFHKLHYVVIKINIDNYNQKLLFDRINKVRY